jgi:phosphocarrier protein NPr
LTVKYSTGLHVRASGAIVKTVNRFTVKVQLRYGDQEADANGIFEIIMLEVPQGAEVEFEAEGPDAERVLDALSNLFADNFGLSEN